MDEGTIARVPTALGTELGAGPEWDPVGPFANAARATLPKSRVLCYRLPRSCVGSRQVR